jgi:hypothetical protein
MLTDVFTQLGTATAIVAAIAVIGKTAVTKFFEGGIATLKEELKRRNDLELQEVKQRFLASLQEEKQKADLDRERFKKKLETEAELSDRIRDLIVTWSNPILNSVRGLEDRLTNILCEEGFLALDPSRGNQDPDWSVSYDYFLGSTMYLFGQYFCWVNMLREKLSFELFQSHAEKDAFFAAIALVDRSLSEYPPMCDGTGNDTQVFRLQQRQMGELLSTTVDGHPACLAYGLFLTKLSRPEFENAFKPLRRLVDAVQPGERRWTRLTNTLELLTPLKQECEALLRIQATRG